MCSFGYQVSVGRLQFTDCVLYKESFVETYRACLLLVVCAVYALRQLRWLITTEPVWPVPYCTVRCSEKKRVSLWTGSAEARRSLFAINNMLLRKPVPWSWGHSDGPCDRQPGLLQTASEEPGFLQLAMWGNNLENSSSSPSQGFRWLHLGLQLDCNFVRDPEPEPRSQSPDAKKQCETIHVYLLLWAVKFGAFVLMQYATHILNTPLSPKLCLQVSVQLVSCSTCLIYTHRLLLHYQDTGKWEL